MRATGTIVSGFVVAALAVSGCARRSPTLRGGGEPVPAPVAVGEAPSPCAPPTFEAPSAPPAVACVPPPSPCLPALPEPDPALVECAPPATACAPPAPPPCAPCAPEKPAVSRMLPGDLLRGHLYPDQGCQCLTFDGVEYALLDVELKSDTKDAAAPRLSIADPDGLPLDLTTSFGPEASACQKARGIVLRKTGTYRATVCKTACEPETFYTFRFDLRLVAPDDEKVHLTPCTTKTVSFVASRGSRVRMTVAPEGRCGLVPKFLSVTDPHGGRALSPERALPGAPAPLIKEGRNGEQVLDFNAALPGRYTVTYTAEKDTEGTAVTSVQLFPPKPSFRRLYHGNQPCPEPTAPVSTPAAQPPEPATR
jgi:hypothetical protein